MNIVAVTAMTTATETTDWLFFLSPTFRPSISITICSILQSGYEHPGAVPRYKGAITEQAVYRAYSSQLKKSSWPL
jgi:hypothetical protein